MMHLCLFGKTDAIRVELVEEDDQIEMSFLVMDINASTSSRKST